MITQARDNKFVVVRPPCLMEDEGNWHVLAICDTRDEVAQFVKGYVEESKGYFQVTNFVYVGSHFSGGGRVSESLRPFMPVNLREYLSQ